MGPSIYLSWIYLSFCLRRSLLMLLFICRVVMSCYLFLKPSSSEKKRGLVSLVSFCFLPSLHSLLLFAFPSCYSKNRKCQDEKDDGFYVSIQIVKKRERKIKQERSQIFGSRYKMMDGGVFECVTLDLRPFSGVHTPQRLAVHTPGR